MKKKVVVTGGNRGIGLEICRQLLANDFQVILTARDEKKGQEAAEDLGADFYGLDVSSQSSIDSFIQAYKKDHDSLDVLINNAGILIDEGQGALNADLTIVQKTLETNLYGPWRLIMGLMPAMDKCDDPRIVNISSGMGAFNEMGGKWPAYRISKTGLNSLTAILSHELPPKFKINAMCPGWVRTDMGGQDASRPVEKGAETATWLATEKNTPRGKFLRDKKVIRW